MPGFIPGIFFEMRKVHKRILISSFICLILFGLIGFGGYRYYTNQPPKQEIKNAIEAIALAKKAEANKYAKNNLNASEIAFQLAMNEWELQNKKFFFIRDFTKVRELANQASLLGNEAWREAGGEKNSISRNLSKQLNRIQYQIDTFEKYYKRLPLSIKSFEQYSKARMSYIEANNEFRKKQFLNAEVTANEAEKLISKTNKAAKNKLTEFYKDFPEWKYNAQIARELSLKGQNVVLISKLESTCYILKSGKIITQFDAEFGNNWMEAKMRMGDNATPEGIYKVVQKKNGAKTKYYKALLLNYPNNDDKKRFDISMKNGSIKKSSKIGDLIQIHGYGGKGVNWTEGCIALDNNDMDKICDMVKINTPIIIIGSEKSLSEYLK